MYFRHFISSIIFLSALIPTSILAQQPKKQFDLRFGGQGEDLLYSLTKTSDGGYIATGWSNSNISGEKSSNSKGGTDIWIIKLNGNYQKEWDKTIGGNDRDTGLKIIENSDRSFLVVGHGRSNIGGDKTSQKGMWDFWVIKLTPNGDKIWDRTYGGLEDDPISDAIQTNDGGYILFGFTLSRVAGGDITQGTRGGFSDLWYVKIDSNGNLLWQNRIGGDAFEESFSIIKVLNKDEYYLTSITSSSRSGEVGQASRGLADIWIIKINGNGQIIWERRFGGSGNEIETYGTVDANENLVITCQSDSNQSGEKSQNSWNNSYDFWVLKINSDGNLIWEKRFGGDGYEFPSDIKINQNQDIFICGGSSSDISGDKTQNLRSNDVFMYGQTAFDYWVIKLNSDGTLLWNVRYGGDINDVPRSLLIEGNDIIISGYSNSNISGDKTKSRHSDDPQYGEDFWILKLSDQNCQSNLFISNNDVNPSNVNFFASNQIFSNSSINISEKVVFDAGRSIIFQPGFQVNGRGGFIGKIGGCVE